jgi:hypothetical protein
MEEKIYRETLFARALERLVPAGYGAAYLINNAGLIFAKTSGAAEQEGFGVLEAAAAGLITHARDAGFGDVTDLKINLAGGGVAVFHKFRNIGETAGEYFIAAVAGGAEVDTSLLAAVAEEIKTDLEEFY